MGNDFLFEIIKNELMDVVGGENISSHRAERITYGTEHFWGTNMWLDRGLEPPLPDWIVTPKSTLEVSKIIKVADRHRIPVIPYGAGSGAQGGTVPLYGGISLDLKKMNSIISIDEKSLLLTAEAGINGYRLEQEVNRKGLTLAHYPASVYGATLGGYIAARGAGTLSTKYGKAEDIVVKLEAVLPSGEVIDTLPVPKHACGPSLLQLLVGSEGTLGVITKVTMRLDPIPETRCWRAYLFEDLRLGLEAGRRMMHRLTPTVIRLYDPNSTRRIINRVLNLDLSGSYMVVGCDGDADQVELDMRKIDGICKDLGAKDLGSEPGEHWWKHRYDFYFPPLAPNMLPKMAGTFETTTTYNRIYDLYLAKKHTVEDNFKDWDVDYIAHFSHWFKWGVMVYDRFIIEKPPQDPYEALQLHTEVWATAARTSLANGGVLNDHHGVGFKLGWLMPELYGTAWPTMQRIKDAIDPKGIMNPGKLGFSR